MACPWEYPNAQPNGSHMTCGADVFAPVIYRARMRCLPLKPCTCREIYGVRDGSCLEIRGAVVWYCLNHAQREVNGGQAAYASNMQAILAGGVV